MWRLSCTAVVERSSELLQEEIIASVLNETIRQPPSLGTFHSDRYKVARF